MQFQFSITCYFISTTLGSSSGMARLCDCTGSITCPAFYQVSLDERCYCYRLPALVFWIIAARLRNSFMPDLWTALKMSLKMLVNMLLSFNFVSFNSLLIKNRMEIFWNASPIVQFSPLMSNYYQGKLHNYISRKIFFSLYFVHLLVSFWVGYF